MKIGPKQDNFQESVDIDNVISDINYRLPVLLVI